MIQREFAQEARGIADANPTRLTHLEALVEEELAVQAKEYEIHMQWWRLMVLYTELKQ